MSLEWIAENPARWDDAKAAIVGGAPEGVFDLDSLGKSELLPGEWWRVERDGKTVGFGWMDYAWADAEILLAVHPDARGKGVGTFILDRLEQEAASRGMNYLHNVIAPTHPRREALAAWLEARKFERGHDDQRLMRRVRAAAD